jgi:hypothetical protein
MTSSTPHPKNLLRGAITLLALVVIVGAPVARADAPKVVAAATDFPAMGVVPRAGGFRMDGYWVWCGSVIKAEDGKYHMFASRWPRNVTFHPGWMTDSEVVRAVSDTPLGPYTFKEVVLPARGPEYWDGRATHNPSIQKHGDTYVLFYMGSTNPIGVAPRDEKFSLDDPRATVARANKRIGVATAKSIDGPWTRYDKCVLETKPGTFYSFLTSNPAPCIHEDGSVLLMFKSRKYKPDGKHSGQMLGVARAPHYLGPYEVIGDEPIFGPDKMGEVEDPFVWRWNDQYNMIAKDMTGKLVGEKHAGVHAVSKDGVTWELAPKPKAWSRTLTFDDGTTTTMGQLERPYLLLDPKGRPAYLFAASGDGPGGFANMTMSFNMAIPLAPRDGAVTETAPATRPSREAALAR